MGCPEANTLIAFLDGGAAGRSAGLEEHLASCATCRRVVAEYAAISARRVVSGPISAEAPESGLAYAAPTPTDLAERSHQLAYLHAAKRVGTVLDGKWRIDRVIGIGGMAQVFAATHRNGRTAAVKIIKVELASEPLIVKRFLREGYVANKVGHPGAVAILDDDLTEDGAPYLVMELLRGRSLRDRIRQEGALPTGQSLRLTHDLLDVLAAAHQNGVIHRDIKPDNLFETDSGQLKVLDFGIARLREHFGDHATFTQSGVTLGTLGYMAPEQARGQAQNVDERTDIWAVGATLFTLLTGRVIHGAGNASEALLLSMTSPVPPMAAVVPGLPASICAVLDTALAFDKGARFSDCRAMQRAMSGLERSASVRSSELRGLHDTVEDLRLAEDFAAAQGPTLLALSTPRPATPSARTQPAPDAPTSGKLGAAKGPIGMAAVAAMIGAAAVVGFGTLRTRATTRSESAEAPAPSPVIASASAPSPEERATAGTVPVRTAADLAPQAPEAPDAASPVRAAPTSGRPRRTPVAAANSAPGIEALPPPPPAIAPRDPLSQRR